MLQKEQQQIALLPQQPNQQQLPQRPAGLSGSKTSPVDHSQKPKNHSFPEVQIKPLHLVEQILSKTWPHSGGRTKGRNQQGS